MLIYADIQAEIERYSRLNGYPVSAFAEAECACGGRVFTLFSDDNEGAAERACAGCGLRHPMADSARYLEDATLVQNVCTCDNDSFTLLAGVAPYDDTDDARWYYIGARCTSCQLVGVYVDWKCNAGTVEALLANS